MLVPFQHTTSLTSLLDFGHHLLFCMVGQFSLINRSAQGQDDLGKQFLNLDECLFCCKMYKFISIFPHGIVDYETTIVAQYSSNFYDPVYIRKKHPPVHFNWLIMCIQIFSSFNYFTIKNHSEYCQSQTLVSEIRNRANMVQGAKMYSVNLQFCCHFFDPTSNQCKSQDS